MIKLTENFCYEEFFVSDRFPGIAKSMKQNASYLVETTLFLLCHCILQPVRDALGIPIIITSGYRDLKLNSMIKGAARHSLHLKGIAADFTIEAGQNKDKRPLLTAYGFIKNQLSDHYGQLILYEDEIGNFINIHVSLPALRHEQFALRKLKPKM